MAMKLRLRLREALAERGVTQSELAARMGETRQYLGSLLEREAVRDGGPGGPTLATLGRLAEALEVSPWDLVSVSVERNGQPTRAPRKRKDQ